ncbi:hypothetical protein EGW08_003228, partial [Elysia chlorotica]
SSGTPYLGLMPGKTRIRTSFDPEHEIPRLHKWFSHNQHPTRDQMMRYMHELNTLESRRGRRPLDLTNIIYWFKNARAAQRRACKALDDSMEDSSGAGDDGRSGEDMGGHSQHRDSLPDSGDPDDSSGGGGGLDCNGSSGSGDASIPPYLPNKNAVYMIPFHPYLQTSQASHARMSTPGPGVSAESAGDDQPYDLSLAKRRSSEELSPVPYKRQARKALPSQQEEAEGAAKDNKTQDLTHGKSRPPFPAKSPNMADSEAEGHSTKRGSNSPPANPSIFLPSSTSPICPPRFPALLDAASKMRQEIPAHSEEDQATSEAELLKLRLKQSQDYADYAMHSNVSRLTAANMAALSLAQMGGLPLAQLPPSLAMAAYYPMDPRFYSAPQHSASSPTPLTRSSVVTPLHPHAHQSASPPGPHARGQMSGSEPRKRRTRVFIDPLTEIPKLEKWFLEDTHPSAFMIDKFCEELNTCEYRHKFPKLEPKNVQLWFKNHRAKVKRMKTV